MSEAEVRPVARRWRSSSQICQDNEECRIPQAVWLRPNTRPSLPVTMPLFRPATPLAALQAGLSAFPGQPRVSGVTITEMIVKTPVRGRRANLAIASFPPECTHAGRSRSYGARWIPLQPAPSARSCSTSDIDTGQHTAVRGSLERILPHAGLASESRYRQQDKICTCDATQGVSRVTVV